MMMSVAYLKEGGGSRWNKDECKVIVTGEAHDVGIELFRVRVVAVTAEGIQINRCPRVAPLLGNHSSLQKPELKVKLIIRIRRVSGTYSLVILIDP